MWHCDPTRVIASSFLRFLDHTQRRTTVGRTPLVERSARRRDLYLTTHNTHNRLTSMPPVGFEPTISAGERPQTYALDRMATGTGMLPLLLILNDNISIKHIKFVVIEIKYCLWIPPTTHLHPPKNDTYNAACGNVSPHSQAFFVGA